MSYLNYISYKIYIGLSWLIKLFIKSILKPYSYNYKSYNIKTLKVKKLKQKNYKKTRKIIKEFYIIKAFFICQKLFV